MQIKTSELTGPLLDWAVKRAIGAVDEPGHIVLFPEGFHIPWMMGVYSPSINWAQGGPLIEKYGVLLSPPTSMVHRNFGYMDKRNGYYESGFWGSTIFGKERKHRRRAFEHPDQPLVAAMRAIVQFELGDTVDVPEELTHV